MRTTNKRRPYLEIPDDEISALAPEMQRVFQTLNARLRTLSELHESTAGLRGPVGIAKQSKKDQRGVVMPGLALEGNRVADAADPIDDQDLVTLAYLKRQLRCDNLTKILEECNDFSELLDDENDQGAATVIPVQRFWGVYIFTPDSAQVTNPAVSPANSVPAYEFTLPFDVTVSLVSTEVTTARAGASRYSVGLYQSVTGALVLDTGPLTAAVTGIRQDPPIGGPVTLTAGTYVFAQTTNDALLQNRCFGETLDVGIINKSYRRWGLGTNASVGGQLPSALGGLVAFVNNRPILSTLFE